MDIDWLVSGKANPISFIYCFCFSKHVPFQVLQCKKNIKMDKYRVLQTIGDGSYGTVKKAMVKNSRELVAIKKLKQKVSNEINEQEDKKTNKKIDSLHFTITVIPLYRYTAIPNIISLLVVRNFSFVYSSTFVLLGSCCPVNSGQMVGNI